MPRLLLLSRYRAALVGVITCCALVTPSARAQTNTFSNGTTFNAAALTSSTTTGSLMNGMLVTWTFLDGAGSFAASWGTIGGGFSGVSVGGFQIGVNSTLNTFDAFWTLTNLTPNRLQSVRFNGAPGRTLFDCGSPCPNPGTPVSLGGRALQTVPFGSQYTGGVTGAFSNIVGIGGLSPVGDLYEQLTITFDDILEGNTPTSVYTFQVDTDNSDFGVSPPTPTAMNTVPEPGTWALLLAGLVCIGGVARRTRPRGQPD